MKKKYGLVILLIFASFMVGCNRQKSKEESKQNPVASSDFKVVKLPVIPVTLTEPEERANFLIQHYWDNTSFTDTVILAYKDQLEQSWSDYLDLMNHVSQLTAVKSISALMKSAEQNKAVYKHFAELADKYLYDPNSPMRNEELYVPVLESLLATPLLTETEKLRPEKRLQLAMKNRPGTKATNFTYTLASGKQGTLHGITADYTLLFINNPGCHACAEYIDGLNSSQVISELISAGKLKILSFYTDTELDEWKNHLQDFPYTWTNSYDKSQAVSAGNLYDLKAIPTLYLLDKNKTVILKDAPLPAVEIWLSQVLPYSSTHRTEKQ